MDSVELGQRIKSARLAKKMTQSDVAGNFITRNMLSLIENGSATPSVKTLQYLSHVLDIPVEKLLSESGSTDDTAIYMLQTAKKLLEKKQYEKFFTTITPEGIFEDEFHALCSIAHMELAHSLAESKQIEQLQSAVNHAKAAAEEAGKGIYANAERAARANQFVSELAQQLCAYYSSLAQNGQTS